MINMSVLPRVYIHTPTLVNPQYPGGHFWGHMTENPMRMRAFYLLSVTFSRTLTNPPIIKASSSTGEPKCLE
jgi:hypothetical protein